jgi:hypothetical protein
MSSLAEILQNITALYAAPLEADNGYGSPVRIPYIEEFGFEFEHDEDEIKAAGVNVESGKWVIGATGEATEAKLDWASYPTLAGIAAPAITGVTPNRVERIELAGGGGGTPYHGLIAVYAATLGRVAAVGFCKAKATVPGFDQAQNEFRRGTINWTMVAGNDVSRLIFAAEMYETAGDLPDFTLAASWDTFFTDFFS